MADRLVEMIAGGPGQQVMQCHCTADDRPEVCVGFALQVGTESVAYRMGVMTGAIDPLDMTPTNRCTR